MMIDSASILHDLDLLDDWLAGKGYGEEAGLVLRAMTLINAQARELRELRAQNRSLMDRKNKLASDYRRLDNFDNNLFIIGQRLRFDADQIDALRREAAKAKKDAALKETGDE